MIWVVKAKYLGDEVEFIVTTEKDDLQDALVVARTEAFRIFQWWATPYDKPEDGPVVHVRQHPNVL